jgi:CRISPR-associated endonuclease Csn1
MSLIFSFDVGKASLGYCVRKGYEIEELKSIIIPSEHADYVELFGGRKRQFRTREAHEKRQNWLRALWNDLGLEGLDSKDSRLVSEFRKSEDEEVCSGVLLRIKLLEGNKLQEWQIFKALWSAIQKRGYDDKLPWASSNSSRKEKKDELIDEVDSGEKSKPENDDDAENKKGIESYEKDLVENCGTDEKFHLPCYLEAAKLCLWKNGRIISHKITYEAEKVRKSAFVAPRHLIEKEIEQLLIKAAEQIPSIKEKEFDFVFFPNEESKRENKGIPVKGKGIDFVLYGQGQKQYASYYKDSEFNRKRGTEWDTQGLLSQKIPRFDNRIIGKCSLIPRLNTCNADDILAQEFKLIQSIRNLIRPNREALPHEKFIMVFQKLRNKLVIKDAPPSINFSLTEINKALKEVDLSQISEKNLHSKQTKSSFFKINNSGRSRLSRPALSCVSELILSGKPINRFVEEICEKGTLEHTAFGLLKNKEDKSKTEVQEKKYKHLITENNPLKGITQSELVNLSSRLGDSWSNYSIQDDREVQDLSKLSLDERKKLVEKELGKISNYVVKNRLQIVINTLNDLLKIHGEPDSVVIEMPRGEDSLDGSQNNLDYIKAQKDREKINKIYIEELAKLEKSPKYLERYKLWKEQRGVCVYTGQTILDSEIDSSKLDVDHIIPRAQNGNNSIINKVLVLKTVNNEKLDRTPYEWLSSNPQKWAEFKEQFETGLLKHLPKFKKKLLLVDPSSEDGKKLIDNLNALQDTRFIAKLGKKLIGIFLGWNEGSEGSKRKLAVVKGSETAEFRREYDLNKLLGDDKEKNRNNNKHHALDAYCMSFANDEWVWTKSENGKQIRRKEHLETSEHVKKVKAEIKSWMEKVVPVDIIKGNPKKGDPKKKKPDETIYGLRLINKKLCIVRYRPLAPSKNDKDKKNDNAEKEEKLKPERIVDPFIREDLKNRFQSRNFDGKTQSEFFQKYLHPNPKRKQQNCEVKRVLYIECEINQEDLKRPLISNGRFCYQNFVDVSKNPSYSIDDLMNEKREKRKNNIQLKKIKQSRNYLIYKDLNSTKDNYGIRHVKGYESIKVAKEELEDKKFEVVNEHLFSGCLIKIHKDFEASVEIKKEKTKNKKTKNEDSTEEIQNDTKEAKTERKIMPSGIYILSSIGEATPRVSLESNNGDSMELLGRLNKLMELGFDLHEPNESKKEGRKLI